jgi:hypothetical protein
VRKTTTTTTAKAKSRPASTFPDLEPQNDLLRTTPTTTAERLLHIRALGQRIDGYIKYMCAVERTGAASLEVREKAVTVFYERLAFLEQELGKVHEKLQLE